MRGQLAERTCRECGTAFLPTRSDNYFCKGACQAKSGRRRAPKPIQGGGLNAYSITVTYMNDHGGWHTVVGWGKTKTQAREDADQQVAHLLEAGWEVASVSSPDSIFRDLCRYPTADRRAA